MNVDRTGIFRAEVVESGVGETKKSGLPQFIFRAKLSEYYDEDVEQWVNWLDYGQEVDAYLCLFGNVGKKKELGTTLNYDQVCKVFGWDGADLAVLAGDKSGTKLQVRVDDNDPDYANKTPFVVGWIDEYDADPVRKIKKLSVEEVKGLNAKYAALLQAKKKPAAPVTAKPEAKAESESVIILSKEEPEAKKEKPKAPSKALPKLPPAISKPKTKQVENYTKQKAWETVVELKSDDCDDDQLNASWQTAISEISNGEGEDVLDGEGWWTVKDKVLDEVGKF